MKTKTTNKKKAAAHIHPHGACPEQGRRAAATLKIPTCETCDQEVQWIGAGWYHARKPEYSHCARPGQGRTLFIADYSAEAEIAA